MAAEVKVLGRYLGAILFVCSVAAASPLAAEPVSAPEDRVDEPAVAVQQAVPLPAVRDEAAMVLVGAALIGIAAAVRRAA